jgi:hypothetical protein
MKHKAFASCLTDFTLSVKTYILGFGYPLNVETSATFLGNLFQLPTLVSFSLQSFTPFRWSKKSYLNFYSLLHFFVKPLDLTTVLQRLEPIWKAVLLYSYPMFYVGSKAHALLSLLTFKALRLPTPLISHLHLPEFPLAFEPSPPFDDEGPKLQGFSISSLAFFPVRTPAFLVFPTRSVSNPLRKWIGHGLFFHLDFSISLQKLKWIS